MQLKLISISAIVACFLILTACRYTNETTQIAGKMSKVYYVHRLNTPMTINARWDKPQWLQVEPFEIKCRMGAEPKYKPIVQAKLLYDDDFVYVIFRVDDRYVRAKTTVTNGPVWRDSCVEFFFTPAPDIKHGFFNLETNAGGVRLCGFESPDGTNTLLNANDVNSIQIAHSLPTYIDPEIQSLVIWIIEYKLPLNFISKYSQLARPQPGTTWRANFYKCADQTSNPHWLTWSPVNRPEPAFHVPESFGILQFTN
jgi:hypothetical protein